MIVCLCDRLSDKIFRQAVETKAEEVRTSPSMGKAAGMIFHDTHPPKASACGEEKSRCNSCISYIRETIVEMGLRPAEELKEKSPQIQPQMAPA